MSFSTDLCGAGAGLRRRLDNGRLLIVQNCVVCPASCGMMSSLRHYTKMHVEKDVTMRISQWRLSLLSTCVLLLAFVIPYLFPQWDVYATQFLRTHLLFIGALLLILLFLLLWKYPQWQVAAVQDRKDRIDLESKSRQTLAQILGGAALLV